MKNLNTSRNLSEEIIEANFVGKISKHLDLVSKFQKGNQTCFNLLLEAYMPLIKSNIYKIKRNYPLIPMDEGDLLQELIYHFWYLTINYDVTSLKCYPSYIKTFLTWNIKTSIKRHLKNGNKALNYSFEYDENKIFADQEHNEDFDYLKAYLTSKEFSVFSEIVKGEHSGEIAKHSNLTNASYFNFKTKIFKKLRDLNLD